MYIKTYRSQASAIRAGENDYGEKIVDMDISTLTDQQRRVLVRYVEASRDVNVAHYTPDGVAAALDNVVAAAIDNIALQ